MAKETKTGTVLSLRLKQARLRAGYTQMELGVLAGIDEFSASARINQYERAVHAPDYGTAQRLSKALNIPVSFLYESDDRLADIILVAGALSIKSKEKLLLAAQTIAN